MKNYDYLISQTETREGQVEILVWPDEAISPHLGDFCRICNWLKIFDIYAEKGLKTVITFCEVGGKFP